MKIITQEAKKRQAIVKYLDSNVMGCQLGDGSGKGSSNTPGVATAHTAKFTIDWNSAEKIAVPEESSNQTATVEYTVDSGYEVKIPATVTVDSASKKGSYTVEAQNFVVGEGSYVTVAANESGKLSNGSNELAFTNTLEEGKLTKTGDTLNGEVEVTENAVNPGKYTGNCKVKVGKRACTQKSISIVYPPEYFCQEERLKILK